ncbi:L-ascorbate metabolism protein UlaG (beta-lactamase superfamily) [Gramella sp. Hel_I_59]|uniref:MBL fold metallo-hydrolase n=1 Tax=Gramella sp. Hel_I_59 TaxID=1249978 RepID=UPI00114EAA48|nr:MBL fold metallo-hydrolase [Gramella sp. Hel_I_59]TQI70804.1 L-ascorbate metabolism protein UlaG (beta-lactamase superfamily) [Gramella sp. Hel_I_59]
MFDQFGVKASKDNINSYERSENWKDGKFVNLEETGMNIKPTDIPKLLYKQFFEKNGRQPSKDIKIKAFNKKEFLKPSAESKMIWFGHSVILLRMNGLTILIDPMFGPDAAPISPFGIKRFSNNTLQILDKLPEIDVVLLSHDHYDHLDLQSIRKLQLKTKVFHTALGVGRHLKKWGVEPAKITEYDWWDRINVSGIDMTFTPTRHFSGRGLNDRAQGLWGGWNLKTDTENIWFSGDSGYGSHFEEVGQKLGPFDFGFMECGQYDEKWNQIHMFPEECVQAARDAQVKNMMPVHWAGFALSLHSWLDPVERFIDAASDKNYCIPEPGEIFTIHSSKKVNWWKQYD